MSLPRVQIPEAGGPLPEDLYTNLVQGGKKGQNEDEKPVAKPSLTIYLIYLFSPLLQSFPASRGELREIGGTAILKNYPKVRNSASGRATNTVDRYKSSLGDKSRRTIIYSKVECKLKKLHHVE